GLKKLSIFGALGLLAFAAIASGSEASSLSITVTPALITGEQLIRASVPLPRGFLQLDHVLVASDGQQSIQTAVRALSWYHSEPDPDSVRHAIITFPYSFKTLAPVEFKLTVARPKARKIQFPVQWALEGESLDIHYP